ncbi:unnamed protein product [Clonostachys rosea f. rosea IK726]|uniref:HTH La-type RNA-binding domain-containing protein n=2 Tax=Bionectria ochroleuca TaxID=29856 RepID=A0A0B7JSJ5_BIOOC|nr:unnamed protein product [Clonostachys rosea f. rosea IK726]
MSDATAVEEPKVAAVAAEEQAPVEAPVAESADKAEAETEAKPETKDETNDETKTEAKEEAKILKTKGQIDYENPRNNRKFDASAREVSDDPVAIRKQVEFYFGDFNFPQDKFMWEQCGGEENKPIAVKKIHSFKRMRSFQPYSAVVAALRDSSLLDVEGEEGEETLKRKVPYKPMGAVKAKTEAATVYVKGFGDETPTTQYDLEVFFSKFGDIKGIKLRRTNEDFFKGSVFVTFADEEAAKAFVGLNPAPKWNDHDLKIMTKHAYCQEKNELIRQGKLEPNSTNPKKFYEGKLGGGRGRGNDRNGPRDHDDWKKRRDYDQKNGFRNGRGGTLPRRSAKKPTIQSSSEATNGKRSREDDGAAGEPAAKKVDVKDS